MSISWTPVDLTSAHFEIILPSVLPESVQMEMGLLFSSLALEPLQILSEDKELGERITEGKAHMVRFSFWSQASLQ